MYLRLYVVLNVETDEKNSNCHATSITMNEGSEGVKDNCKQYLLNLVNILSCVRHHPLKSECRKLFFETASTGWTSTWVGMEQTDGPSIHLGVISFMRHDVWILKKKGTKKWIKIIKNTHMTNTAVRQEPQLFASLKHSGREKMRPFQQNLWRPINKHQPTFTDQRTGLCDVSNGLLNTGFIPYVMLNW